jgi:hypothetical protein
VGKSNVVARRDTFPITTDSIQPYKVFRLRRRIFAISVTVRYLLSGSSNFCCLPAHDRPARLLGDVLTVEEVLNLAENTTATRVPDRISDAL